MRMTRSNGGSWRGRRRRLVGAGLLTAMVITGTALAATGDLTVRPCLDDNDSGPDVCPQSTDGLGGSNDLAVSPDGKSVYVVSSVDHAIVRFNRNTTTGALTPQGCIDDNDSIGEPCAQTVDGLNGPAGVVVSSDGKSVYVAGEGDDALVRFNRNTTSGALTPAGCIVDNDSLTDACAQRTNALEDIRDVAVSPDGLSVYAVAGVQSNAIVRFDRNPATGALTPRNCIEDDNPGIGTDTCATNTSGLEIPTAVTVSPDNKSVYTAAPGNHAIAIFARNTSTGALGQRGCLEDNDSGDGDCAKDADGLQGIFAIALSPDSKSLYAGSITDNAVARFSRNTTSGGLVSRGCVDDNDIVGDACVDTTEGLEGVSDLAVSPDGESLYVAAATDNALTAFGRNPVNGALQAQGCIEDGDGSPTEECAKSALGLFSVNAVALSANGLSVYTTSGQDTLDRFDREPAP